MLWLALLTLAQAECRLPAIRGPAQVTVDRRPAFVELPEPVLVGDSVALIGWPTYIWRSNDSFGTGGVFPGAGGPSDFYPIDIMVDRNGRGRPIPPPAWKGRMLHPRAFPGRNGAIELLWGVPVTPNQPMADHKARELWRASYRRGRWSTPVRVIQSHRLEWLRQSAPAIDARGTIHLMVSGTLSSDSLRSGLIHVAGAGNRWQASLIEVPGFAPGWVGLLQLDRKRLLATWVGGVANPPPESKGLRYGVYAHHSDDGGRTWSQT